MLFNMYFVLQLLIFSGTKFHSLMAHNCLKQYNPSVTIFRFTAIFERLLATVIKSDITAKSIWNQTRYNIVIVQSMPRILAYTCKI